LPRILVEGLKDEPPVTDARGAMAPAPGASGGTRGFLFSDLRGYTAFVEAKGDQAGVELLDRYRALVRRVIARYDGAEIRTEGDSVYVVFPNASAAVEAGLGIVAAAAEAPTDHPIRVGIGIHAGETVATTEGLVGGAVNIAARVCSKARAGEVLVTDTVRALTRTFLPYRYTSLGTQQLKGIAGGIPLYRVEASPPTRRARLRRQLSARRGRVLTVVALATVLVAVGAGAYAANRGADCQSLAATTKDVVARIDPARNCVVATYAVGQRPGPLVPTSDAVWVGNIDDWTLTRVDPTTQATRTTGAGGAPVDLAADAADNVYALIQDDGKTTLGEGSDLDRGAKINSSTNRLEELLPLKRCVPQTGGVYQAIAFFGSRLWISQSNPGGVARMEFGGGFGGCINLELSEADPAANAAGPIAAGVSAVWIASASAAVLYRFDAGASTAVPNPLVSHGGTVAIDASGSSVWLGRSDGYLTRFDPLGGSPSSFDTGAEITAIAAGDSSVWAAHALSRSLERFDPSTGKRIATIPVGGRPADVAVASDGFVWVTIQGP
jgi:class 3 adenylate cyclase